MLWGLDVLSDGDEAAYRASGLSRTAPLPREDDRFYFVHDGQLNELTLLHIGEEDRGVHNRFVDSFAFQK